MDGIAGPSKRDEAFFVIHDLDVHNADGSARSADHRDRR
jgi:hypothetical protein